MSVWITDGCVTGEMSQSGAIVLAVTVGLCTCVVLDLGRNNRIEVNLPWLPCMSVTDGCVTGEMSQSGAIVLAVTVGLCHCVVLDLGRNNRIEVNLPWLPCMYKYQLRFNKQIVFQSNFTLDYRNLQVYFLTIMFRINRDPII
jgi:hypothetical protein